MKYVTRTVVTSTITPLKVRFEKGAVVQEELKPIVVNNREIKDELTALKEVQKVYGKKDQFVIKSITLDETVYGVDFDTFMKNAKVIERPESQQKKSDGSVSDNPEATKPVQA